MEESAAGNAAAVGVGVGRNRRWPLPHRCPDGRGSDDTEIGGVDTDKSGLDDGTDGVEGIDVVDAAAADMGRRRYRRGRPAPAAKTSWNARRRRSSKPFSAGLL